MSFVEQFKDQTLDGSRVDNSHFDAANSMIAPSTIYNPRSGSQETLKYVRAQHNLNEPMDTHKIDTMILGKSSVDAEIEMLENQGGYGAIKRRYPGDNPWQGTNEIIWTPYDVTRAIVKELELDDDDILYDLGSGYGRVVLYAGITTPAACKGVEMVEERVDLARQAQTALGLDNVEFKEGDVLQTDFSDGDVFYTYSPFSHETYEGVLAQLKDIANAREQVGKEPITIVARGSGIYRFQNWLRHVKSIDVSFIVDHTNGPYEHGCTIGFFQSIPQDARRGRNSLPD